MPDEDKIYLNNKQLESLAKEFEDDLIKKLPTLSDVSLTFALEYIADHSEKSFTDKFISYLKHPNIIVREGALISLKTQWTNGIGDKPNLKTINKMYAEEANLYLRDLYKELIEMISKGERV